MSSQGDGESVYALAPQGALMPTYTIQRFDRRHRPLKPRFIVCVDDDNALQTAALIRHSGCFTLNQGERRVWTFEDRLKVERAQG